MSVARCKSEVSSQEFLDWQLYYEQEPFGLEMLQLGQLNCMFYNSNRKKGAAARKFDDFVPGYVGQPKKRKTTAEVLSIASAFLGIESSGDIDRQTGDGSDGGYDPILIGTQQGFETG